MEVSSSALRPNPTDPRGRARAAAVTGDHADRELERRRAATPTPARVPGRADANPSNNPTLPSIRVKSGHHGPEPDEGAVAEEHDDTFVPGAIDLPDDDQGPLEPRRVDWSVGMPTSVGTRFRILRPHAQGGIGKVSVAFDAELQREVALKQIKPERADDSDSRARFLLEAEVTGRLEHPGIVPVYGLGTDDEDRPFYAMRFVRGTSFEEAISAFHQADEDPRRDPAGAVAGLAAPARPVRRRLPDRRLRPQPGRAPSRPEAGQHPARAVQRVAGGGLGPGQGVFARCRAGRRHARRRSRTVRAGRHRSRPRRRRAGRTVPKHDRIEPRSDDRRRARELGARLLRAAAGLLELDRHRGGDRLRHAGLHEPRAGRGPARPARAGQRRLQPGGDALHPARRPSAVRLRLVRRDGDAGPGPAGRVPAAAEGQSPRPRVAGGGLLEGDGRTGRRTGTPRRRSWPRRSSDGWPTSRCAPIASRPWRGWPGGARRHRPIVAGGRRALADRRGRPVRRDPPGRPRAAADRAAATGRRGATPPRNLNAGEANRRAEVLRRRDAISRVNLAYREYLDDNVALADELLDGCPEDLRAWEWSYARRLGHSELRSWTAASDGPGRLVRGVLARRGADRRRHRTRGAGWARARPASWSSAMSTPAREAFALRRAQGRRAGGGLLARRPHPRGGPRVHGQGRGRGPACCSTPPAAGSSGGPPSGACRSSAWRSRPTAARSPPAAGASTSTRRAATSGIRDAKTGDELGPRDRRRSRRRAGRGVRARRRHAGAGQPRRGRPPRPRRPAAADRRTARAGTSTSSTPSPSARTAAAWPRGGWDKTIRLWDRADRPAMRTSWPATGGSSAGWPSRPTAGSSSPAARTGASGAGTSTAAKAPRSTATPGSSTAWPSGPTGRWPPRAAWTGRSSSGRRRRPTRR